ncbi:putative aspartic-type endopeptidase CTSD [Grifola frondosa]|uniref:Putative aspartic-type endopeptidase CTSD n=1 Tax=Grifola frondosa TaxID=5627 RepID=A0A1C7M5V9_GRIFR|nr:putative aspartic-type endopeptidase CTSD [Grifola frondosa]
MQLALSFTTLLASLLVVLSVTGDGVQAAPARRSGSMVTLPLKRIHQARSDIHPQVLLQQHINRSLKRHARMTGRAPPSKRELEDNLTKRLYIPAGGRPGHKNAKRYNRSGINVAVAEPFVNEAAAKKGKGKGQAKGGAAAAGAGGAAAGGGAGAAAGGAAGTANTTGSATGSTAASDGGPGISQIDVTAAQVGGLTDAGNPTANNSLGLDIEANDVGYIAVVQMGTPPQDYKLLMDSGSADLWVGAENCQSQGGGGCGNHTFLGTQSSSSFVDSGKQFQVTYGTGSVAGDIVTDNVNIAGLALNTHTFGVATTESVDFSADSVPFDGLMGLAQSTLSEQQTLTPIESLAKAGLVTDAITSYKISRLADQKNDGEITFGGLDSTKFDPNSLVTFANVNTQGFWEGAMSVSSNGQDLGLQGRTAILDTGTTLIVAPAADAQAVHATISGSQSDGQGGFTIPCTTNASIALTFGGQSFAIDTRDLLFAPVDPANLQGDCVSGISSGNIGGATEWLVGDVFLKNAYFSTDVTNNQISLAKLV